MFDLEYSLISYCSFKISFNHTVPNGFNIIVAVAAAAETWSFQCKNAAEKQQWLQALSKTIKVDPAGFKSTSIAVGAFTQTDQTTKFTADSETKSKVRYPFGRVKNFSDAQLASELDEQQHQLEQQLINADTDQFYNAATV